MASAGAGAVKSALISVDYEVFGRVQGVFFRKFTQEQANKLGLVGWVQNSYDNTVVGNVQGPEEQVAKMKDWLRFVGSPYSTIQKTVFKNEKEIKEFGYKKFSVTGGW